MLSLGANGLAGTLIAFGAQVSESKLQKVQIAPVVASDTTGQSDFNPVDAENVIRFFHPDPPRSGGRRSPSPNKPGPTGLSKAQALDDIMQRMADGRTIDSQDTLAADWNRPKQTVSDWLREWRRIGVIPAPVRTGRCKATVAM
jgi:hypothetical protein